MRSFILGLWVVVICSCVKPIKEPAQEPKTDRRSIVFGRLQFEGGTPASYIVVENDLRFYVFRNGEKVHVWPDGFFYAENVLRGTYEIYSVYSDGFGYRLPPKIYEKKLVESASIAYLGSYQVKPLKFREPNRGVIGEALADEEAILLERLRQEVKGTAWQKMVEARLKELTPSSQSLPSQ